MSFASPAFLAGALLVPLLGAFWAWQVRRRRRYAVRFPGAAVLAGVSGTVPRRRRRVPAALLACSALALAVAAARPQATVAVPVERASVMLVTDESGSMSAGDVRPSRLDAARGAARTFLDRVPDKLLVGFVGYSGSIVSQLEPTTDHGAVETAIDGLRADGGTATGDALTAALDRLQARRGADGRRAPAAIVLLSDGKTTDGTDPAVAAARAAKLGIPIYTVALGTPDGVVTGPMGQPVAVPPDPETLRRIAQVSGGRAFETGDAGELDAVYEDLGSKIGTRTEKREVTAAFAGGALLLLLGGLGTGVRRRGRVA
ncbi:MAG TPA: VWA domain-containing protein [Solirubrobacteraceae bacterium]